MEKPSTATGLFQRLLARPTPAFDDAADLGTAFGLDLSFAQAANVAEAAPAPRPTTGWIRRLGQRARSTP